MEVQGERKERKEKMSTLTSLKIKVPAGIYYVGDPCYHIPDSKWDDVLVATDYFTNPVFSDGEHYVLGVGTVYGDGVYYDQNGNEYPVDSGTLGLVSEHSLPVGICVAVDVDHFAEELADEEMAGGLLRPLSAKQEPRRDPVLGR